MHKSRRVLKQLCNLFFMKATMLNVHSFSTDPITWTTIILANFRSSKRLRLRTIDVEILHQSFVRGLNWFFSHNDALELCDIVILKWLDCKWSMWIKSNLVQSINLTRVTKSHSQRVKVRKKNLFFNYWINCPILWVYHTQYNHNFLLWKSYIKSCPFTFFLDLVHCHVGKKFSDRMRSCCTFNVRIINIGYLCPKKINASFPSFKLENHNINIVTFVKFPIALKSSKVTSSNLVKQWQHNLYSSS